MGIVVVDVPQWAAVCMLLTQQAHCECHRCCHHCRWASVGACCQHKVQAGQCAKIHTLTSLDVVSSSVIAGELFAMLVWSHHCHHRVAVALAMCVASSLSSSSPCWHRNTVIVMSTQGCGGSVAIVIIALIIPVPVPVPVPVPPSSLPPLHSSLLLLPSHSPLSHCPFCLHPHCIILTVLVLVLSSLVGPQWWWLRW